MTTGSSCFIFQEGFSQAQLRYVMRKGSEITTVDLRSLTTVYMPLWLSAGGCLQFTYYLKQTEQGQSSKLLLYTFRLLSCTLSGGVIGGYINFCSYFLTVYFMIWAVCWETWWESINWPPICTTEQGWNGIKNWSLTFVQTGPP